jgi:hypothetical protein
MTTRAGIGAGFALAALLSAGACGPATVRPVSYPDPEVPCPGGRTTWSLQIIDHRADQVVSEKMVHDVRDAIEKSFPGCKWTNVEGGDTIAIEIVRLASHYSDGGWDAAAEWNITVRDAQGGTLTEFSANEEASSPNYSGRDNEKETMSEAFRKAVERTAKGLRGLSAAENVRPREETPGAIAAEAVELTTSPKSRRPSDLTAASRRSAAAASWNEYRTASRSEVS